MNKFYFLSCVGLLSVNTFAQDNIKIDYKDGSSRTFPTNLVDTLVDNLSSHKVVLSIPSETEELSYPDMIQESQINLNGADKKQSFNLLQSISILQSANSKLSGDYVINVGNQSSATIVIPYLNDFSNLKVSLKSSGSYVYVDGKKFTSGDAVNFSKPVKFQIVAFNGDVRSYEISVKNSSLPILSIDGSSVTSDWSEQKISLTSGISNITGEVKGKGSHFKSGLKNSYSLKFDDKQTMLSFPSAKRWVLLSAQHDPSLLRTSVGFDLAKNFFSFDWTPSSEPVELVVNGQYQGTYFLTEQIRICKNRIEDGVVISAESEVKEGDDSFVLSQSGIRFVMTDPETGFDGTKLLRSKGKLNAFESILWKGQSISNSIADMKTFADWYVFSEWMKNEDMLMSDDYLTIRPDGSIAMGPIWDQSQTFGSQDEFDEEGWVSKDNSFVAQLLKNNTFRSYVTERLEYLSNHESDILSIVTSRANAILESAAANEAIWHSLGASQCDVETVTPLFESKKQQISDWLIRRLQWMKQNF